MKIFTKKNNLKIVINLLKKQNKTIGFVPTMGSLHKGHLSLISSAKKHTNIVIVSVFVNPTQFNNKEDLEEYPKNIDGDINLLKSCDCDILYAPDISDVYNESVSSERFEFDGLENKMEGEFRDRHFDGVGTIVKRLFQIVDPTKAFFGEKDFQQLQIIKKLVEKENLSLKVFGCPIFRESDGLAMSSRNTRLSVSHRKAAPFIYDVLKQVKYLFNSKSIVEINKWVLDKFEDEELLELEYFTIADELTLSTALKKEKCIIYRGFIAVYAGKVRLIDNIQLV